MRIQCVFTLLFAVGSLVYAADGSEFETPVLPDGALNDADRRHFYHIFDGFQEGSLKEIHYSALGNSALGRVTNVPCSSLSPHFEADDIETRYYALSAAQNIKGCVVSLCIPNHFRFFHILTVNVLFLHSSPSFPNRRLSLRSWIVPQLPWNRCTTLLPVRALPMWISTPLKLSNFLPVSYPRKTIHRGELISVSNSLWRWRCLG